MDELNNEEIQRVTESLEGYYKEKELQERKVKALKELSTEVSKNMERIIPIFKYEEMDAYWDAQRELYNIKIEEDLFKTQKILTTIVETIPSIEKTLERLKGEDNE